MSTQGLEIRSRKGEVSEAEWKTRVDLAAAYRLVAMFKWDDLVFTHITARVPGSDNEFLINPYGLMYAAMPCCTGVLTVKTLNWCTLRNSAISGAGAAT